MSHLRLRYRTTRTGAVLLVHRSFIVATVFATSNMSAQEIAKLICRGQRALAAKKAE